MRDQSDGPAQFPPSTTFAPKDYKNQRQALRERLTAMSKDPLADQAQGAAHLIIDFETDNGSQFIQTPDDQGLYLFSTCGKQLIEISNKSPHWCRHLIMTYGINARDLLAPKITNAIQSYTLQNGIKRQPRNWVQFKDGDVYLNRYDGTVYRLTGSGVTVDPNNPKKLVDAGYTATPETLGIFIENNGQNVLFMDNDEGNIPSVVDVGPHPEFDNMFKGMSWVHETVSGLTVEHQSQIAKVWTVALAFPDFFKTKPIWIIEGAPGSGKSACVQMIQQTIYGSIEPVAISAVNGDRDLWVTMTKRPILNLDNCDDDIAWLPSLVNAYTTLGYRTERKLHTNSQTVRIQPHCFIVVPSKDPKSFRADDTINRSLPCRMASRFEPGKEMESRSMRDIQLQLERDRPKIYGAFLYYVNRIVAAMKLEPSRTTTSRLGDWEIFCYPTFRAYNWDFEVPDLMAALDRERTAFAAETDVFLDVLRDWMARPGNPGRPMTSKDFFNELSDIAETTRRRFVKSPQAVAQRIRAPHIHNLYRVEAAIVKAVKIYRVYAAVAKDETS